MPVLLVVAGPNGSGKSTLTSRLPAAERPNLIDPDAIARKLDPVDPSRKAVQAGRDSILLARSYLASRSDFTIETTLAGNGVLATMKEAKSLRYRAQLIYIAMAYPELNVERVRLRVSQGGHDVPSEDVRRRYERSLANAPVAIKIADESSVYDNSGQFHRHILSYVDGRLTWQHHQLPTWCADLQNRVGSPA